MSGSAQLSGFGFPSRKHPLFGFIVAHEGLKTDGGVGSLARKLEILGRLRLFRMVVTVVRTNVPKVDNGCYLAGGKEILFRRPGSPAVCDGGALARQRRFMARRFSMPMGARSPFPKRW